MCVAVYCGDHDVDDVFATTIRPLVVIVNSFPPVPSLTYMLSLVGWMRSFARALPFSLCAKQINLNYAYAAQHCTDSYASCWPK
jgi:hypothetical protein